MTVAVVGGGRPGGGRPVGPVRRARRGGGPARRRDRPARRTPATTRPRPSCSALARGSGDPLAGRHAPGLRRRSLPAPAARAGPRHHPPGLRGRGVCSRGTTRTTPTRASPAPGCATTCCRSLERELGPGVAAALARTAALFRADADALDQLAATGGRARPPDRPATWTSPCSPRCCPRVRSRVLRAAALAAGCPAGALTAGHVRAVDGLVVDWHGQGRCRPARAVSPPAAPVTGSGSPSLRPATEADRGDRRARGAAGGQGPGEGPADHRGRDPRPDRRAGPRRSTRTTPGRTCCSSASSRAP